MWRLLNDRYNWLLYLDLADLLVSSAYSRQIPSGSETFYRSAISRSYYGVFGKLRVEMEKNGHYFTHSNVHQQLIEWLRSHSDKQIASIGKDLDRLRHERNSADYDANYTLTQISAEKSLSRAHSIISSAEQVKLI